MTASLWQSLAQVGVERMLNPIPEGLLIAGFAWLLLRIMKQQNSGTRFAVWFSALLVIVALTFVPRHVAGAAAALPSPHEHEIVLPSVWAMAIFVGWISIATLAVTRLVAGLVRIRKLRRECSPISPAELPLGVRKTIEEMPLARSIAICRSSAVAVPTAIGFFKPAILIPEWVLKELSAEDLKIILLHECAHLERWDDWTNLAQKIARAVFFFHPAVWWIEKRLSLEREMACDDVVLATTANSRAYAECLVAIAEKSAMRRSFALAQAVLSHAQEISLRLAQILNVNRPRATRVLKPALVLMSLVGILSLIVLPDPPTFIAFESRESTPVLASAEVPAPHGAPVVPASTRIRRKSAEGLTRATARNLALHALKAAPAKRTPSQPNATPLVDQAALKHLASAPQFVLVVQSAEYGRGSTLLSFTVWRVTFVTPAQKANQQGAAPRSI